MTNDAPRCVRLLEEVQQHLHDELLPFWRTHGLDEECGGYLTYLNSRGAPTGETVKTLLCQARMIYTYSSLHRAGHGEGAYLSMAKHGVDFVVKHFWDEEHGGWFWTAERDGTPLNMSKLTYGHSFMIYALSEYAIASGDAKARDWALRTSDMLQTRAADNCHGGYYEFMERDWSHKPPGKFGGDRKSYDVHMHLMECMTNLYELTDSPLHKRRTQELVELLLTRVLHPETGLGIAQFTLDWKPLGQILFADVWGSDRDVEEEARPMDNTSFGHNVEFGWLLWHTVEVLGLDPASFKSVLRRLLDHCLTYGIDWQRGGVYCEGPHAGPARERNKEFWQQAETLVGMLDGYLIFGDERYLDAYENVHRFVMDHVINHEVGEWYPLFDEQNNRLWDYMGHAWKINYHTVRAMLQSAARLKRIVDDS